MDNMAYICLYKSYLRTLSTLTDAQFGKLFRSLLQFSQDGQQPSLAGPLRHVWPGIAEQYLRDAQQYEMKVEARRSNGAKGGNKKKENLKTKELSEQEVCAEDSDAAGLSSNTTFCSSKSSNTTFNSSKSSNTTNIVANVAKEKENTKEKEKKKEKAKAKEKEKESVSIPAAQVSGREEAPGAQGGALAFLPPTLDTIAAYIKAQGLDAKAEEFWDYYEARGWKMGASPMQDWKAALRAWARAERRFTNGKADTERIFSQGARYGDFGAVV